MRPVCLDEGHRGRDSAEQLHVRLLRRGWGRGDGRLERRARRRLDRHGRGSVLARRELECATDDRVLRDQAVPGLLEQSAPLRIDGAGRLEILVEEVPDVAEIHSVDAFCWHCLLLPYRL